MDRLEALANHENSVVANAYSLMADSDWTLAEYIEYIEDISPADFRKYYGNASITEAKKILLGE